MLIADDTCDAVSDVHAAEWALSDRAADVAPQNELFSPCEADVIAARISMCRHQTWHKPDTPVLCADAYSMNMHGRAAAMVTPIGDK